ncbi:MAG: metallophosphoesterase family protein [Acetivibrionales bacterium]|jgi:exonuclease SbcD|nr:DNA repair exonuclease [Clostridiaceae bacterium]
MDTVKFVHCADIHLDAPIRDNGIGTYSDIRRKDIRNAFLRILDTVKQENAQLLLISGDFFEQKTTGKSTMEWLYMMLSQLQVPVVIIPGNHDPYILNSWYRCWEWPSNVTVLTPENPSLIIEELNLHIYGMGFSTYKEDAPDLSVVSPPVKDKFNIFMFHGTLDMNFTNQAYKPVTSADLERLGYDYYALGHFHRSCSEYPLKNAYNPGSPEPLGFDEQGVHGIFLVTMRKEYNRVVTEVSKIKTANRQYHDTVLDVTGCKTLDEVKIRILALLEGFDPERDIIRIKLKGRTGFSLEEEVLSTFISQDWLYLRIDNETRKAFDLEELLLDNSLAGAFAREMKKLIDQAREELEGDPENKDLQQKEEKLDLALSFGLEALSTGRIEWPGEF